MPKTPTQNYSSFFGSIRPNKSGNSDIVLSEKGGKIQKKHDLQKQTKVTQIWALFSQRTNLVTRQQQKAGKFKKVL